MGGYSQYGAAHIYSAESVVVVVIVVVVVVVVVVLILYCHDGPWPIRHNE